MMLKVVERYLRPISVKGLEEKEIIEKGLKKDVAADPGSRFIKNAKWKIELSYIIPKATAKRNEVILANDAGKDEAGAVYFLPQIR